jgi:flagellar biosynthetic protein FlhB
MADEESAQERTENPTAKRREEARQEGQIARSPELAAAAVLLTGTIVLGGFGGTALAGFVIRLFQESGQALAAGPLSAESAVTLMRGIVLGGLLALLPFAIAICAVAVLVNLLQTRGAIAFKLLQPKGERVNPLAGLKRIVSLDSLATLVRSILKLGVLALITWMVLHRSWPELTALSDTGPAQVFSALRGMIMRMLITTGVAFLMIAVLDYGYQYFKTAKSLRMTRQEVVREMRESEGDPIVKSRMLALGRSRARKRMLQQVPQADVIVVNPTEIAIALKYDPDKAQAPIVVAMGERKLAARIREIAMASKVPIVQNIPVARALLSTATVGKQIPPVLYAAVAEILAFVYRQRGRSLLAATGRHS